MGVGSTPCSIPLVFPLPSPSGTHSPKVFNFRGSLFLIVTPFYNVHVRSQAVDQPEDSACYDRDGSSEECCVGTIAQANQTQLGKYEWTKPVVPQSGYLLSKHPGEVPENEETKLWTDCPPRGFCCSPASLNSHSFLFLSCKPRHIIKSKKSFSFNT